MEQRKKEGQNMGLIKLVYHIPLYDIMQAKPPPQPFTHLGLTQSCLSLTLKASPSKPEIQVIAPVTKLGLVCIPSFLQQTLVRNLTSYATLKNGGHKTKYLP